MPRAGLEPARILGPRDFKSLASTNSAISAQPPTLLSRARGAGQKGMDNARRHPDLNRRMKVLQTFALPLGYAAKMGKR